MTTHATNGAGDSFLERTRRFGYKVNLVALAVLAVYATAEALILGLSFNFIIGSLVILALNIVFAGIARGRGGANMLLAVSGVAQVSLIVAANNGNPMQIDGHMYYFAWLAILVLMIDWRVILSAAAITAVHHLGFNFLLPHLVFPNGASFVRVVFHALAVVVETGALVWFTFTLEKMLLELFSFGRVFTESAQTLNLAVKLQGNPRTEVGTMAQSANSLLAKIYDAIHDIRKSGDTLAHQAHALDEAGNAVLSRSNAQVETADTIARTMNESASQVASLSEISRAANQRATILREESQKLQQVLRQLEVNSAEIDTTTVLISGISEQTNLLALNASIEAARAGDAGRGFAVVADEVRTLAGNASNSASSIAQRVTDLKASIDQARGAIIQMAGSIEEMYELNTRMNQTVQSQAAAIEEVSTAAASFKQQLAEVVSELTRSSKASNSVLEESKVLKEKTGQFQL